MPLLSVVVPVFNERDNIKPLLVALTAHLSGIDHEIILVDDGSTDGTVPAVVAHLRPSQTLIALQRNYGQSTALQAGLDRAAGEWVVTMDGDLQHDPADIPKMLDVAHSTGCDVVTGNRLHRKDGLLFRKMPSAVANALIRYLTGVHVKDYGCTLRLIHRPMASSLRLYGEMHRFIPVLLAIQGARMVPMKVVHHPRVAGKSKYGLRRVFKVLTDLVFILYLQKSFHKPMHAFGGFGLIAFCLMIVGMTAPFGLRWIAPLLLAMAGIQCFYIGIMAELQMRIYYESQNKKTYQVRTVYTSVAQPVS